jgi:hypothetical protein
VTGTVVSTYALKNPADDGEAVQPATDRHHRPRQVQSMAAERNPLLLGSPITTDAGPFFRDLSVVARLFNTIHDDLD